MHKVCIVTTAHQKNDTRIFYKQARTLVNAGYDTTLVVQNESDEIIDGIKILSIAQSRSRLNRLFVLPWIAFFKAMENKYDVYHFHDMEFIPFGILLKICTRAKIIYDVHEDYPAVVRSSKVVPSWLGLVLSWIVLVVEILGQVFFDAIVPVTDKIASKFMKNKVVQVRNYPIISEDSSISCELSKGQDNAFRLIFVGGITEKRGIREMVNALSILNIKYSCQLDLYGKFSSERLKNEIENLEGYQYVNYYGWVDQATAYGAMKNADAGLVLFHPETNHVEALPNKLFEYMSAGVPVIASEFPYWKDIVERTNSGLLVNPMDQDSIVTAIEYLMKNKDIANKMGKNGKGAIFTEFNWSSQTTNLLNLYKELMK